MQEQLHATSLMTMQNRFVIDTTLAQDQNVCSYAGDDECCSVIPLHTGENGNLTKLLEVMKRIRKEHVENSNWKTKPAFLEKVWNWLDKLSWKKVLQIIGVALGALVLIAIIVTCCVLPLVRGLG